MAIILTIYLLSILGLSVFVFVFFGAHGVLRNEGKVDGV